MEDRSVLPSTKPEILAAPGSLAEVVKEAEDAVITAGEPVYQRAGELVRPVTWDSDKQDDGIGRELPRAPHNLKIALKR